MNDSLKFLLYLYKIFKKKRKTRYLYYLKRKKKVRDKISVDSVKNTSLNRKEFKHKGPIKRGITFLEPREFGARAASVFNGHRRPRESTSNNFFTTVAGTNRVAVGKNVERPR